MISQGAASSRTQSFYASPRITQIRSEWHAIGSVFSDAEASGAFSPGKILCREGDTVRGITTIREGLVKVLRRRPDGIETVIGVRSAGWPLGMTSTMLAEASTVTIVTLTDCRVGQLSGPRFLEHIGSRPDLSRALLRLQSLKLREQVAQAAVASTPSARRRLEFFLTQLADMVGVALPDGSVRLAVPLAQQDLADAINVSPETLSRLTADLERERLIARRYHRVTTLHPALFERARLDADRDLG